MAESSPEGSNKAPKPALKQPTSGERSYQDKSFRWDEKTIAEQDLERGTRQKVDEPKTPYMGPVADPAWPTGEGNSSFTLDPGAGQLDNELYRAALTAALNKAKDADERGVDYWDNDEEVADEERKRQFEEKRKLHYRMFR